MNQRAEQLSIIRDTILEDPTVEASLVWDAAKIALEDNYLNDLMIDWAKAIDEYPKACMLDEIFNYTEETLRKMNREKT